MNAQGVQVVILNDSRAPECEVGCGTDWSDPEVLNLAVGRVAERFGNDVRIEYADLARVDIDSELAGWKTKASRLNLSFPLLLLNGQVKIAGVFDIRRLLDVIEVEVEEV